MTAPRSRDTTVILAPHSSLWLTLTATVPPEIAGHLSALGKITGVIAVVKYYKGEHPVAVLVGQRRPSGAMMRLVLFWTATSYLPDDNSRLLEKLEQEARTQGVTCLRAGEDIVRRLDPAAFEFAGEFHERRIGGLASHRPGRVPPIFPQTTGFTCGPASLAMGLAALDPNFAPDRADEIAVWREATTVIGITGPGGCDPYGLALAARRRGLVVEVLMSSAGPILLDRANTEQKRDLMEFVQAGFKRQVMELAIPLQLRVFGIDEIQQALARGFLALLLIDQTPMMGYSAPHWILVHGHADGMYFVNDPWIEAGRAEQTTDVIDLPVAAEALDRMAWYGEPRCRAAVLIKNEQPSQAKPRSDVS